jgi:hypothetical protein
MKRQSDMEAEAGYDGPTEPVDWLIATLRRNPEAFLVLAAGAALLLRRSGGARFVERMAGSAGDYASTVAGYAEDRSRRLSRQASRFGKRGVRLGRQAQSAAGEMIHEQPLAVAALGLAAGAAVAAMLPRSEIEERAFGPAREALSEAAGGVVDSVKEAAGEATRRAQEAVVEHGIEGLRDVARDAARGFTEGFSGEAGGESSADERTGAGGAGS